VGEEIYLPNVRLLFQPAKQATDNSPAIYRWEKKFCPSFAVPKGRLNFLIQPSLRDCGCGGLSIPSDKSLGYYQTSLTGRQRVALWVYFYFLIQNVRHFRNMSYSQKLRLLFWTLRYLTLEQMLTRGKRVMRQRFWRLVGKQAPQPTDWRLAPYHPLYAGLPEVAELGTPDITTSVERAREIAARRFSFLNQTVDLSKQEGWHDPQLSRLWRYHLHSFDYARDLLVWSAVWQEPAAYETFRELANSWIAHNQKLTGDGWHPFTISVRIVNWLHAVSAFHSQLEADEPFRQSLLNSIYGQATVLSSDFELDVRGNHLLKNLRAMIWAGVAFEGAEPQGWFQRAIALLKQEIDEQVLPDGGHFERSPGYHLIVLRDCLEIGLWLRRNRGSSPPWLDDAVRRMLDYLVMILPSDAQVPLLKDTAWDAAPAPHDLLAAGAIYLDDPAYKRNKEIGLYPILLFGVEGLKKLIDWPVNREPRRSKALAESGHYVLRSDRSGEYLILDVGKPCPDYLPAHAQADLLTYELSIDGQRVVVDSGVYEYTAGPWRDYFRSTRAHNTVEVAGENQSEVWDSFRVARRAQPGRASLQESGDCVMAQGEHNGYSRLPVPVVHRRTIVWRKTHFWLVVDELWGRGQTRADSHIHLHPNLLLEKVGESVWRVQGAHTPLWVTAFGEQGHTVVTGQTDPFRQGWYSERFGQLQRNTVLTLHAQGALPICCGYVISRHEPAKVKASVSGDGHQISVTQGDERLTFGLSRDAIIRFR
jgi:uncharacterized heparinase superfamily protein